MFDLKYWLYEINEGIATIKINNPIKMNAFNEEMSYELDKIITDIKKKQDLRVVILTSVNDNFFSAGADMDWFMEINGPEAEEVSFLCHRIFGNLEKLSIPVISVIKGLCLTAGLELILCSDMIYATDNAKFGQIEVKYGITPGGGGTQRLTRLIGPLHTKELVYRANIINAEKALQIGLINDIFPQDVIDQRIQKICKEIIQNSKTAISDCKNLIQHAYYSSEAGFHSEEIIFGKRFASGEPKKRLEIAKELMLKKK